MSSLPGEKTRYAPSGLHKEESLMLVAGTTSEGVRLPGVLPKTEKGRRVCGLMGWREICRWCWL